jgi:transcription elongation factor/antiterminator RfaH
MAINWYAMRSKPNKESFLAGQLEAHNVEVFFPCLRVTPVNPRSRKLRPYFPNYLFVHVDLAAVNASDLHWMPGASGLVSFGSEPAVVPDHLISTIKKHVDYLNASARDFTKDLRPGEEVEIQYGSFAGYKAIFDTTLSGQDRVRVLLNLLQARQVPVELKGSQIRRVKRP